MESPGITFDVQWKKKPGAVNREEDCTSIGIWDLENTSLDWQTFKSYVCQNLGTVNDITVAYIDSEGDELPIESECEFQEALKFARQRARKGRGTVLKVDRQGGPVPETSENRLKTSSKPLKHEKIKYLKSVGKSAYKILGSAEKAHSSHGLGATVPGMLTEEKKLKGKKHNFLIEHGLEQEKLRKERIELMTKFMEELKLSKLEKDDAPPQWFKKYMQKMKSDIVAEVTTHVLKGTRHMLENSKSGCKIGPCHCAERSSSSMWQTAKAKKKRNSDEDSSDGALGNDTRDHKLLKKIEKLHKQEKKLEKKLDSKLEKLEYKTKRMMEKKSQSKTRCDRVPEKKPGSRKRSSDMPVGTYLMDAILLSDGAKPEVHIRHGEHFTKVWEVMNTGTLPWTDKTELRQTWRTLGLEPEEMVVKCPILEPGEKGQIAVKFRAPEFPGTFESYWHFYHMGDRFGHWIGCAVVVDPKDEQPEKTNTPQEIIISKEVVDESKTNMEHAVDLTMKSQPDKNFFPYSMCTEKLTPSKAHSETEASLAPPEEPSGHTQGLHDAEYESDTDSENLSVISGTVTLSSDSDDENFVVVPMPACFVYDIPLGTVETIPIAVTEKPEKVRTEKQTATTDISEEVLVDISLDSDAKIFEGQKSLDRETGIKRPVSPLPHNDSVSQPDMPHENLRERVYAVDMAGHCLPLETNLGSAFHYNPSENDRRPSLERPLLDKTTKISFQVHTDVTNTQSPNDGSSSQATDATHTTGAQDPFGNVIHILPETLVTGAVNVASSAFNTARSVISNLRSRQSGEFTEWQFNNNAGNWAEQTDRSTTESLKHLIEMGFTNKILNVLLLQRYDNDIAKVVAELLTYEDHNSTGYTRPPQ